MRIGRFEIFWNHGGPWWWKPWKKREEGMEFSWTTIFWLRFIISLDDKGERPV